MKKAPLWAVTIWDKRFNGVEKEWQPITKKYKYLLADELSSIERENGDVRILYTGKAIGFTTKELAGNALCSGEVVAIPWGGIPRVQYYRGEFVTGDNRIATSRDPSILLNKYLYYFLSANIAKIASFYRGASLKHPSMRDILSIEIPIPTTDIQAKVVSELDGIIDMIKHVSSQIPILDEQVKSLFNEMFAADCSKEIPLKSVANVGSSKRVFTDEFVDEGIPFYRGSEIGQLSKGQEPNNPFRITREHYAQLICDKGKPLPGDILMPSICDKGQLWIVDDREFYYKDGRVLSISPNRTRVMPRFLCDQLKITLTKMFKEIATGATFAEYKIVTLKEIPVFVPDMPTQRRYCEQAEQIDKLRFNYQKQIDLLNELMEKKMEEYFGGEEDA